MEKVKREKLEQVLREIGLGEAPEVVKEEIMKKLNAASDRLVIESFWRHLSDEQTRHFRDFSAQMVKVRPELSAEGTLYEFMALYEDLTEKVGLDLEKFLAQFVADFRTKG